MYVQVNRFPSLYAVDIAYPYMPGFLYRPELPCLLAVFVTQRGSTIDAAHIIKNMPGKTRLPTILHYVDKRTKEWKEAASDAD